MPSRSQHRRTAFVATGAAAAFAVYPILYLLSENYDRMYMTDAIRPFMIAAGAGLAHFGIAWLLLGDCRKATLITPAVVATVFAQRPIHTLLGAADLSVAGVPLVALMSVLLLVELGIILRRTTRDLTAIFNTAALIAGALVLLPVLSIVWFEAQNTTRGGGRIAAAASEDLLGSKRVARRRPDIYYIVLDAYGRDDVLQEVYGFDNRPFLESLEKRGFFVARASRSNYSFTILSLSSSLNATYLDQVVEPIRENTSQLLLTDFIKNNSTARILRAQGYSYVSLGSGWYMSSPNPYADYDVVADGSVRNQFEIMILDLLRLDTSTQPARLTVPREHRDRVLFQFDSLGFIASSPSPKFVFCHIISPHQPFVFDEHGNVPTHEQAWESSRSKEPEMRKTYKHHYVAQLKAVNTKVLESVDAILRRYDPDNLPIIIVQGDHGPESEMSYQSFDQTNLFERMSILNCVFLPPDVSCRFDDDTSPVNTFRIILNGLFDAGLEVLPNRHYFTTWGRPYDPIPIPEERMAPTGAVAPSANGGRVATSLPPPRAGG